MASKFNLLAPLNLYGVRTKVRSYQNLNADGTTQAVHKGKVISKLPPLWNLELTRGVHKGKVLSKSNALKKLHEYGPTATDNRNMKKNKQVSKYFTMMSNIRVGVESPPINIFISLRAASFRIVCSSSHILSISSFGHPMCDIYRKILRTILP